MDAGSRAATLAEELRSLGDPANVAGMARFGINPEGTLGVPIPTLRAIAKREGRDPALAEALWASGVHEARILASLVDVPAHVTERQMERWVEAFDSWDVCDQVCANLFDRTPFAWAKATEWAHRDEEFVRRAGFVLMARLAVRDKTASAEAFEPFLPLIAEGAADERNFVKKAANWALRQIGKRGDARLHTQCVALARELSERPEKSARWVGRDALRELTNGKAAGRMRG